MPKRKSYRDGLHKRSDSPYWWASYTDASGRRTRRTTGTEDRKEAEALLAKWKLEAHRGRQWEEQPERTFDELMLAYLPVSEREKRSSERDRNSLKRLYPFFTGRDLGSITPMDVRAYVDQRRNAGVGPGTINREIGLLSAALNYARREWGWAVSNPAAGRRLREPEGRVRWINREEAKLLVAAARTEPRAPHLPDFILLGLNTGMRRGEMLGLEWERVDLTSQLIYLGAAHQKSGRLGSVPLNKEALMAMRSRAAFRELHYPSSRWVFCDRHGNRVGSVKKSFASACRKARIEDFHQHDLRHTCAAWLVQSGVPLIEVRDLLRHSTVLMTERYAHLAPHNARAAVAALDNDSSRSGHGEVVKGMGAIS